MVSTGGCFELAATCGSANWDEWTLYSPVRTSSLRHTVYWQVTAGHTTGLHHAARSTCRAKWNVRKVDRIAITTPEKHVKLSSKHSLFLGERGLPVLLFTAKLQKVEGRFDKLSFIDNYFGKASNNRRRATVARHSA